MVRYDLCQPGSEKSFRIECMKAKTTESRRSFNVKGGNNLPKKEKTRKRHGERTLMP